MKRSPRNPPPLIRRGSSIILVAEQTKSPRMLKQRKYEILLQLRKINSAPVNGCTAGAVDQWGRTSWWKHIFPVLWFNNFTSPLCEFRRVRRYIESQRRRLDKMGTSPRRSGIISSASAWRGVKTNSSCDNLSPWQIQLFPGQVPEVNLGRKYSEIIAERSEAKKNLV